MCLDKIREINNYLKEQLWMDFEIHGAGCATLKMTDFLDESGKDEIEIIFSSPFMMLSAFSFTYEGNRDFLSLVTGEEAVKLNIKYSVTQVNKIFRLSDTNINDDMYIIAKDIEFSLLG